MKGKLSDSAIDLLPDFSLKKLAETFNKDARDRFLELLAATGRYQTSAFLCGVSPLMVKKWEKDSFEFAEKVRLAKEFYGERLEHEAHRRAVEGWEEPVFTKDGVQCGSITRYSDKLLELLLKKNVDGYREKSASLSVTNAGVLVVGSPAQSIDEWEKKHRIQG